MQRSSKVIGSLQRAIDILNLFDERNPELGNTDIAKQLGLHKSTASSLIRTLEINGYLAQNPTTRKYRLGFRLLERASSVLNQIPVRDVAIPALQSLRDELDETVNLGILDGGDAVYIERLLGTKLLGMHSEIGKRAAAHSTALGKAILACLPMADAQAFIKQYGLPAVTTKTITDRARFLQELDKVREQGFALDDEENEVGGRCVAAPVFDHAGKPVASVSVSAPSARLAMADVPRIGARVLEIAKAISRDLGYLPRAF
ncbi:MAG: IclR family transcriptional regulator [Chloroflexi bacterium]|nr:IclR family transcriptional regulator [Chloroflexota bacterium]